RNSPIPPNAEKGFPASTARQCQATKPCERQRRGPMPFPGGKTERPPPAKRTKRPRPQIPIRGRGALAKFLKQEEANRSSARQAIVTGRQFAARCSVALFSTANSFYFVNSRER